MKNKTKKPRREQVLLRQALSNLHVRYWEMIRIFNPDYTGMRTRYEHGGYQWLEFVVRMWDGRVGAILLEPSYANSHAHKFETRALQEKQDFLSKRGTPFLVVARTHSQSAYEIRIEIWMRKEKRNVERLRTQN